VNHVRLIDVHDSGAFSALGPATAGLSPSDSLFAMLDGQIIRGRSDAWRAEVVSILEDSGQTWVQIATPQSPLMSVVLRMRHGQMAGDALDALRAWTDLPEERRPGRIELDVVSG
jgi:hypothetical protein